MGGSDPRPTASMQCMVLSVGTAEKQLESLSTERRKAILHGKEEVNGETVWNTEIGCVLSGSAPAPGRSSGPVTVSCVKAHLDKLQELAEVVITDFPPWPPLQHQITRSEPRIA